MTTPPLIEQTQQQRDSEGGCGKGDDDAGDQQRLRYWVAPHPHCRAPSCDGAEQQENSATDNVETDDFTQWLRVHNQSVQAKAD